MSEKQTLTPSSEIADDFARFRQEQLYGVETSPEQGTELDSTWVELEDDEAVVLDTEKPNEVDTSDIEAWDYDGRNLAGAKEIALIVSGEGEESVTYGVFTLPGENTPIVLNLHNPNDEAIVFEGAPCDLVSKNGEPAGKIEIDADGHPSVVKTGSAKLELFADRNLNNALKDKKAAAPAPYATNSNPYDGPVIR